MTKKILIPIAAFDKTGGFRVLSELANNWILSGHKVDFLVHQQLSKPYFPTRAGIRTFRTYGQLGRSDCRCEAVKAPGSGAILLGMLNALNKIGKDYDVIFANHSLTAFPVALSQSAKAKKIYYVQAYEPEYYNAKKAWKSRVIEALSTWSYSLPLYQIANAPIYIGYKRVAAQTWIPPGIDLNIFYRRAAPPILQKGRVWTLGTIGRHELGKGTKYVLEAFEKLALVDPYVQLKVAYGNLPAGWSHERAEIVVPKNDSELADFYRSVDAVLAPGIVQLGACHYPVIEAMACGTPVITTGYLPADRANAWIVPICNSSAIVEELAKIQSLESGRLKEKLDLANAAVARFSWTKVADEFLAIFSSAH